MNLCKRSVSRQVQALALCSSDSQPWLLAHIDENTTGLQPKILLQRKQISHGATCGNMEDLGPGSQDWGTWKTLSRDS